MTVFGGEVLPRYETHRAAWLAAARAVALSLGRTGRRITVDDVRATCPPPEGCDPRVMGGIFAGGDWVAVGFVNSRRRACHRRVVREFQRVEFVR